MAIGTVGYHPSNVNTIKRCRICGGSGAELHAKSTGMKTKTGEEIKVTVSKACICQLNEVVERQWALFHPESIPSIPRKESDDIAAFFFKGKFLHFSGDKNRFLRIAKAYFVHNSLAPDKIMFISPSLQVVQDYYVAQKDEEAARSVNDLIHNRELVVLLLDCQVDNKALANVVADLVVSRKQQGRRTWVWSPNQSIHTTKEHSAELAATVDTFKKIKLAPIDARNIRKRVQG